MNDTILLETGHPIKDCNNFTNLPLRESIILRLQYQRVNESSIEAWREIPIFKGYEISSAGRIRHNRSYKSKSRILVQTLRNNSYFFITLSDDTGKRYGYPVDKLMIAAFNSIDLETIRRVIHIDGLKHNNKIENLNYVVW